MNKILILILMFLLVLNISTAQPPFSVTTISDADWDILFPVLEFYPYNEDLTFNFHVYNENGSLVTNSTSNATFHLYNRNGTEIYSLNNFKAMTDADEIDWEIKVNKGNFTQYEDYIVFFSITDGNNGAAVKFRVEITETGRDESNLDSTSGLAVEMFVLFLILGVFSLSFIKLNKHPVVNELLHGLCIVSGLALLLLNIGVIVTIADNAYLGVNREIFRLMWIIGWGLYCSLVFVVIKFMFNCLGLWKIEKKKKRMGDEEDEEHQEY